MNILLAAATLGEITPTLDWLRTHGFEPDENRFSLSRFSVQVVLTGVGIMAATESLTRALLTARYDFAVQAGVAGVFNRGISLGEVVRVERETLSDLGAEDRDGSFLDIYTLGLGGKNDAPFSDGRLLCNTLEHAPGGALASSSSSSFSGLRSVSAITVQTVSGSEKTIAARAKRYGADVETMEGAPFHYCCLKAGVPFVQLRAVSNYIEPRDRGAWRIGDAVSALNSQLIRWLQLMVPAGAPPLMN